MISLLVNEESLVNANLVSQDIKIKNININDDCLLSYGRKILNVLSSLDDDYTILSSNDEISESNVEFIKNNIKNSDTILFCSNDCVEIDALTSADLVNLIKNESISIPNIICVKNSVLKSLSIDERRNFKEISLKLVFATVANCVSTIVCTSDDISNCEISLDDHMRAKILRELLKNVNIEDLFPNKDWENFAKESAAVSYHTLCAMFIKFNDLTTANECLNLCQVFVDSPRSLALRGLIALENNNYLDAVANIVSSLQLYEKRKSETNSIEKLNTKPDNLNIIEAKLTQGLDALNKRDNQKAATIFADAVYDFDNFFGEQDLIKIN
ncbi:MAG: hypothetical protein ACOX3T_05965 [Bdellovibrionota bacterium]